MDRSGAIASIAVMRHPALLGPLVLLAAPLAWAAGAPPEEKVAQVRFQNTGNQPVGEAVLRQTPNGVLITVNLRDLPPGEHGFHVHEKGTCLPPFDSAGGHFNPTHKAHGFEDAKGPHAGDLPNLVVPESGTVKAELFTDRITLDPGKPDSVIDQDGSALVIHAGADDYRTNPAGDSGARIACGVIERPRAGADVKPHTAERPDRTPAEDVPRAPHGAP
jgi:Cu-Zn family superoxide dismutase